MNPTEFNNTNQAPQQPEVVETPVSAPVIGYCRASGKPLTAENAEYVNGILYSREEAEKLKQRTQAQAPGSPYNEPMVSVPRSTADISPGWAFVLGLIPGVGAIYNQQYAKGLMHIIIFATLVSMADRPTGAASFFGFLIAGWFFYMPFEAYHTAQKRQRGLSVDETSGLIDLPTGMRKLPIGPLLLIIMGVVFLLDNLGLLRIDDMMRFWPVLLIAAGVIMLMQRLQAAAESPAKEDGVHVE